MTEVLVTGASGFIGTNLCQRLVSEGYDVKGVDIEEPRFEHPSSVGLHKIDLTESSTLPNANVIVHLAAHSQVQPVVSNPERAVENVTMTQNVLQAASEMGSFVVNASSRDVYGSSIAPSEQEVTPDSPNGYAASKLGSEALVNAYRHTESVSAVSMRFANVYGPMDYNRRVIPLFIAFAEAGEELTVFGEGTLLDFVHVDDVCEAILEAIRRYSIVDGESINIGSGTGTTLSEVAEFVDNTVEACPGWTVSENRSGDVNQYVSDLSKAESILGYSPSVPLQEGLKSTIEWYRDRPRLREEIVE